MSRRTLAALTASASETIIRGAAHQKVGESAPTESPIIFEGIPAVARADVANWAWRLSRAR
jgi:hypothetical protein